MDMFKMIKEAAAMKSKLGQIDKALREKILEVEHSGVTITINAKSEIIGLKLSPEVLQRPHEKVEKDVLNAIQQATKKSHDAMNEEAKKLTQGMNIPGLM
ncbi:MAG: hypothetical protein A2219_04815 [Elusimicrobia bacterium RIFOXYA2_FULL_50_26]|nr:MAG: hypothetical protein A2219_04815 [Elusimicrobia bacterium RIFOXYA2_FULL_50_26]OGS24499.1 MAG: hypothetical protein A2314_04595 [Elusimicrobia bacterium RIFOXYB2_FULL_50_12]